MPDPPPSSPFSWRPPVPFLHELNVPFPTLALISTILPAAQPSLETHNSGSFLFACPPFVDDPPVQASFQGR